MKMADERKPMANIAPFGLRMQPDLKARVEGAAKANNRSLNAEIVATLEEAYPAPISEHFLSGLKFFYFQWAAGGWHDVDDDSWARFRSGEVVPHIFNRMNEPRNYFAVVVIDDQGFARNIIAHSYVLTGGKLQWAADEYLSEDEITEYKRLMIAASHTSDDENMLRDLRSKMEPAFKLPAIAIQKLREKLTGLASDEDLETLLERVS